MPPSELFGCNIMAHRHKTSNLWAQVGCFQATQTLTVTELSKRCVSKVAKKRMWLWILHSITYSLCVYLSHVRRKPVDYRHLVQPGERDIESSWDISSWIDGNLKPNLSWDPLDWGGSGHLDSNVLDVGWQTSQFAQDWGDSRTILCRPEWICHPTGQVSSYIDISHGHEHQNTDRTVGA